MCERTTQTNLNRKSRANPGGKNNSNRKSRGFKKFKSQIPGKNKVPLAFDDAIVLNKSVGTYPQQKKISSRRYTLGGKYVKRRKMIGQSRELRFQKKRGAKKEVQK